MENADMMISMIAFRIAPFGTILLMIFSEASGAIDMIRLVKPRTRGNVYLKKQDMVIALGI